MRLDQLHRPYSPRFARRLDRGRRTSYNQVVAATASKFPRSTSVGFGQNVPAHDELRGFCFSMATMHDRHFLKVVAATIITCSAPAFAQDKHAQAEAGAAIYDDYCSRCHGEGLRNTSGGVTFDLRRLHPNEHERFLNSVLNGKKDMPPWRGVLRPDQIEEVWAYIRATLDR
jgi:mono/diheme cytochrome c family protein